MPVGLETRGVPHEIRPTGLPQFALVSGAEGTHRHVDDRWHLALGEEIQAQKWLRRAMRLDPANGKLRADYARAKAR